MDQLPQKVLFLEHLLKQLSSQEKLQESISALHQFASNSDNFIYIQLAPSSIQISLLNVIVNLIIENPPQNKQLLFEMASLLTNFVNAEKQTIFYITQQQTQDFYNKKFSSEIFHDKLMLLQALMEPKNITKIPINRAKNYFKFRGPSCSIKQSEKSVLKWALGQGYAFSCSFYPLKQIDSRIFSFITQQKEPKNKMLISGIQLFIEDGKITYHIVHKKLSTLDDSVSEDYSVSYGLGTVTFNQWNYLTLEHEPPKTFQKPHLTYCLNSSTPQFIVAEFPKIPNSIEMTVDFFSDFFGFAGSIFLFSTTLGLKLQLLYEILQEDIQIDTIPQIFDKQKLFLLLLPQRASYPTIYDIISANEFILTGLCDTYQQSPISKIRYVGGINLLLPFFYMARFYQQFSFVLLIDTLKAWVAASCDFIQEEMEKTGFFEIVAQLIIEIDFPDKPISLQIIDKLLILKQMIVRPTLVDQYVSSFLWNLDFMRLVEEEYQTQKSYCMMLQTFYFVNPIHFSKQVKEVKEIMELVTFKLDLIECCTQHCQEMGMIIKAEHPVYEYLQNGLLDLVGLIMESDTSELVGQIKELLWLVIKSSPCLQIRTLKLCQRILVQKRKENGLNIWKKLASQLVDQDILHLLVFFVQNSPCLDVKAMSVKFINLLVYEKLNIINEFELTSLIENKLRLLSHIDSKYIDLPAQKKKISNRNKKRRNTYQNVIELPYMFKQNIRRQSGKWLEVEKAHNKIERDSIVDDILESLLQNVFESTTYIASLNQTTHHSAKMRMFYDAIMEWALGLIPSDLNSTINFTENVKIVSFHTIDVLQALFSISPFSFKCFILENLILLIKANNQNGDILVNQTLTQQWLLDLIHQQPALFQLSLELFTLTLTISETLYDRIKVCYIWARGKVREKKDITVKWTLRVIFKHLIEQFNVSLYEHTFALVKVMEEVILCLDQYLDDALQIQELYKEDIVRKRPANVQMCLTFRENLKGQVQPPASLGQEEWVDAILVELLLTKIFNHLSSVTTEKEQEEFLVNMFKNENYVPLIRLVILYIQYQLRLQENPPQLNELSNLILLIYCHRNSLDRNESEMAILFMYSFFQRMELTPSHQVFQVTKPLLSKLYDEFDPMQFQNNAKYRNQILKHPTVIQSVRKFNCNYAQLMDDFNDTVNDNYYRWTISMHMNNKNKIQIVSKLEQDVFQLAASIMERNDSRRTTFLQLEESSVRQARNHWKKIWRQLRELPYFFSNSQQFIIKVSRYQSQSFQRPFLKKRFIDPDFVEKQLVAYKKKNQTRQFRVQSQNISVVKFLRQHKNISSSNSVSYLLSQIKNRFQAMTRSNSVVVELEHQNMLKQERRGSQNLEKQPLMRRQSLSGVQLQNEVPQQWETFTGIKCQWVKSLTTRNGSLTLTPDGILIFQYEKIEQKANHLTLKLHTLRDDRTLIKSWNLKDVELILPRIYILNEAALELFFQDGNSVYLAFMKEEEFQKVMKIIYKSVNQLSLSQITQLWQERKISNFAYIMQLNMRSARSFKDLTRYPVVPWVLKGELPEDIEEEILLNDDSYYRQLDKSMGACGDPKRVAEYIQRFDMQNEKDGPKFKFHFGTHYSSSAIVAQYLVRLEPFTSAAIEIQGGGFDLPDRIFSSVARTWQETTQELADVRELVPEFYYLPEVFLNKNNLDMGKMQNQVRVNHVDVYKSNPYYFVALLRLAFESSIVDANLHHWIDLIWGCKQQGESKLQFIIHNLSDAIKSLNIFYPLTYKDHLRKLQPFQDSITKLAVETQVANFGQTPEQLFQKHHVKKNQFQSNCILTKDHLKVYESLGRKNKNKQNELDSSFQVVLLQWASPGKLFCLRKNGNYSLLKWISVPVNQLLANSIPFTCGVEKEKTISLFKFKNSPFTLLDRSVNFKQYPVIIMRESKLIVFGGMWEGYLCVYNMDVDATIAIHKNHCFTITAIAIDNEERRIITGTKSGECGIWNVSKNYSLNCQAIFSHHFSQINCISISNELKLFATASNDQRINMYNLFNGQFYGSIKHPDYLGIQSLNISSCPLPVIIFSSDDNDIIYSYSVNGNQLGQIHETSPVEANIVVSANQEYLVYSTLMGSCKIYSLPFFQKCYTIPPISNIVTSITISDDKRFLILGQQSGELTIVASLNNQLK